MSVDAVIDKAPTMLEATLELIIDFKANSEEHRNELASCPKLRKEVEDIVSGWNNKRLEKGLSPYD